jgi:SAM-dependent methyltransferase
VLAVDLSMASLAYAARKTREAGIPNIEYAEADILKLGLIGRTFDRIEAVGVLHHLADPRTGWRSLLSILRPGCIMDVGLYSKTARRAVVAARQFVAARGYRGTKDGIRRFRRELLVTRPGFANSLVASPDFYSTSGCRDLLFHVVEHQFNILEIAQFLSEQGLVFLGFRLAFDILDRYRRQFPDPDALTDLNRWNAFEEANPSTFASMYRFAVRKKP